MSPSEKTNRLFKSVFTEYLSGVSLNDGSEDYISAMRKIQNDKGIPALVMFYWLKKNNKMSDDCADNIKDVSIEASKMSSSRTSCIRLKDERFMFVRNGESLILDCIPAMWNSDMELDELVSMDKEEKTR